VSFTWEDAQLPTRLQREGSIDAAVPRRDRLQLLKPEQVGGERVPAGARPGGRDRVRADREHGEVRRRFLVEVVRLDRVHDALVDAEDTEQLSADEGVDSLDVMVDRLADVVQHPRLASEVLGQPELGGENAAEVTGFLAVQERVLPVGEAVVQRPDQFRELRPSLDLHHPECTLSHLHHLALRGAPGLLDQRWDLGRLDAAVHDFERSLAGDLAPDGIDGAERRLVLLVVDPEFGAGLLGNHGERRQHALAGMVIETLE